MLSALSVLTLRGRCLLAAGVAAAVCSVVLNERDLLRVAAFVMALPLLAVVLVRRSRLGLAARREVVPERTPVGTPATVRLHVRGTGHLPINGVTLVDTAPHALGGHPRFHLNSVRHKGTVVDYTLRPSLRGVHQIGPLHTRTADPFGFTEFHRELAGRTRLVVIPQVVPLRGLPAGSGLGTGEDGTARLRAGHGDDDVMVRQYRHGDDMRRVHWKTTARRDELMVRVEERPWHGGVTVLLDRRSAAHRGSGAGSSLEWAVSAAASICVHLHQHGQQVRLVTEDGRTLAGGPDSGDAGRDDTIVLDSLAAVRPSTQRDLVCGDDPGRGWELVAVLGHTTTAGVAELTRLRPQGTRSLALLLNVPAWARGTPDGGFAPQQTARRLRAAGWVVAVAEGPHASVAEIWDQLCQQTTNPADVAE